MTWNLHVCVPLAAVLILLPTVAATEESCAGTTRASGNGAALLQITSRGTEKVNVSRGSDDVHSRCGQLAANVPLTSSEYKNVKESCCLYGMAQFIQLVTETPRADAPHMGYKICNKGFAPGIAAWHGCDGVGKDKTFEDLLTDIESYASDPCTTLAKPGEACAPRPAGCTDYPGNPLTNCGCSQSKAVPLDFKNSNVINNNLAGQGPLTGETSLKLRFEKVGRHGDPGSEEDFDLEIEAIGDTPYVNADPSRNGIEKEFGQIGMSKNTQATFRFTLKKTGTLNEHVQIKELLFSVFDIDGVGNGHQFVSASDFSGYVVEDGTRLTITKEDLQVIKFTGTPNTGIGPNEVPNPKKTMDLTQDQRNVAVMLIFKDVSTFELTFGITPLMNPPPAGARSFLFGGTCSLSDHCGA